MAIRNIVTTDQTIHIVWSVLAFVFLTIIYDVLLIMTDRNLFWSNVESKIDHTRFIAVVLHLTFSSQCHSICIRMNPVLPVCSPYVCGMLFVCICMYPYVVCTDVLAHVHGVQPGYFSVSDEASLPRRLTFLGVRHAFLPRIPSSYGARTRYELPKNVSHVWG